MLLEIDPHSEIPIYQQLIDKLLIGIAKGELKEGEQLPSVRQLADEIGVNMMTVSKAYAFLKEEGYIITDRRNGTKVCERQPVSSLFEQQLTASLELILAKAQIHQMDKEAIHQMIDTIYQTFN